MSAAERDGWLYLRVFPGAAERGAPADPVVLERAADSMLLHHLLPCMEKMRRDGVSRRFFFIRYAEDGYHLRVRCLCQGANAYREGLSRLHASLKDCMTHDASIFPGAVDARGLRGDGRLLESVYEPELEKYCGMHGMQVAEEHFEQCSRFAGATIRQCAARLKRDHVALWIMGQAMWSLGLQRHECAAILAGYSRYWQRAFNLDADVDVLESTWLSKSALVTALLPDRDCTTAYARRFPEVESALGGVRDLYRTTVARLAELEGNGMLDDPIPGLAARAARVSPALGRSPLTYLLVLPNLIHMMNNRLGVHVATEALLAYCFSRALMEGVPVETPPIDIVLEPTLADSMGMPAEHPLD